MGICKLCGSQSPLISETLGLCISCIRNKPEEAVKISLEVHAKLRVKEGYPPSPPKSPGGLKCNLCSNNCSLKEGETSYCGFRRVENGKMISEVSESMGKLAYYYDPLPTNCCATWFCPAGTGAGYPKYAARRGPERGFKNLAVFFLSLIHI